MQNDDGCGGWPRMAGQVRRQHGGSRGGGRGAGPFGFGGPPPWLGAIFGPGGPGGAAWGHGFRGGRGFSAGGRGGPRARRGDVRTAILGVLGDEELNGYQVIQRIGERTDGGWRPSPGSVYPTISQLEDEGLVEEVPGQDRRLLRLSEAGRAYAAEHADELAEVWAPFDVAPEGDDGDGDLKAVVGQTVAAIWQVATTGSSEQQREAVAILADTRRRLYGLLAEGPDSFADDQDDADDDNDDAEPGSGEEQGR